MSISRHVHVSFFMICLTINNSLKDIWLHFKRPPFVTQKAAYCKSKGGLLLSD